MLCVPRQFVTFAAPALRRLAPWAAVALLALCGRNLQAGCGHYVQVGGWRAGAVGGAAVLSRGNVTPLRNLLPGSSQAPLHSGSDCSGPNCSQRTPSTPLPSMLVLPSAVQDCLPLAPIKTELEIPSQSHSFPGHSVVAQTHTLSIFRPPR